MSSTDLAVATARLNLRLRNHGRSARELWTQRDQFTGGQLPLSDYRMITTQHQQRLYSHPYSERSKNVQSAISPHPRINVGSIVYLVSDRSKLRARDRCIVTDVNQLWCHIKMFTGPQLRTTS